MGLPSHNVHLAKKNSTGVYVRHRPETTLLYQIVREYWPEFQAELASHGKYLPAYVSQGLLVRDAGNSYLTAEGADTDNEVPINHLLGSSITYRIAMGPQQGRKVFTLQTLPDCGNDPFAATLGKAAGFSLHAGVAARANERDKLERLCRYIALQGCRVLRRLGTIASAQDRQCPPSLINDP